MIRFYLPILASLLVGTAFAENAAVSWEVNAGFSAVGGTEFRKSSSIGDVRALDTEFSTIASVQAKPGILVRFGLELQRFDLDRSRSAPLPGSLESLAMVIGGDFQIGEAWLMRLDVHPGFYGADDRIRGRDFDMPITLGGSYFVSADLQLVIGASLDFNRKYPVLPAVGVRWKFARDWVLDAILPTPRLEYNYSEALTFYVGADFQGETYRVNGTPGRGRGERKLKDAVVDYTQIRVGAGTTWTISPRIALEVEAGCVPVHDFDFHRADVGVRAQGIPPYAGISLKADF